MANSAVLAIKVIADTKQAQGELSQTSSRMGKFQSGISKLAVPAAIAGAAILKFGASAVSSARESEVATARLNAVFKAMGDETGKSAKIADDYASTLSRQIGVDDEVIKAGEAKLATFSRISDATAMMDGRFKRATAAGADLAAAGFGSIESNAVLLGKALQDPIKGMSALSRVGVTLTESQQKQAKAFAESGDYAKAQEIILAAVEKQVKGTAKATATSADKSKVAWGEFMESFGRVLLPIVDAVTMKFASLADFMNKNVTTVQILVGVFAGLIAAILAINAAFKVYLAVQKAIFLIQKAVWLTNPIFLVVAAVVALVAVFVILYKKNKAFRDFVNKMWAGIKTATRAVARVVSAAWKAAMSIASAVVRKFGQIFRTIFNALKPVIRIVTMIVRTYFQVAFAVVKTYLSALRAYFVLVFNVIKGVVKLVVAIFKGDWHGAMDAVRGIISAFKQFFVSIFRALPGPVQDIIRKIGELIRSGFSRIRNAASGVGDALSKPFETVLGWINKVIDAVENLIGKIGNIKMPSLHLPSIPGLGSFAAPVVGPAAPQGQPVLTRGVTYGGRLGAGTTATAGGGGPTFIIQGALDPEAVARQIDQLLTRRARRLGRV